MTNNKRQYTIRWIANEFFHKRLFIEKEKRRKSQTDYIRFKNAHVIAKCYCLNKINLN